MNLNPSFRRPVNGKMKLYHIVARSENGVIGKDNKLPWHFSADLKRFKQLTMENTVIMGRKTFESIGSKPLPGRENFVLTHSKRTNQDHLHFFNSLETALKNVSTPKAFIIGGENLFKQTMARIDGIFLTRIQGTYEGDAFYPPIPAHFEEREREVSQDNSEIEFIYLENTKKSVLLSEATRLRVRQSREHLRDPSASPQDDNDRGGNR